MNQGNWELFSYDLYKYLRDHTEGFQSLAAFQSRPERVGVRRSGDPRAAQPFIAQFVSGNYFSTFGVPAYAGRLIADDDNRTGAAPVAIIAYRTWRERYGHDPSVIGATFSLNGSAVTVIGVTPPGFFGDALRAEFPDFWLPLADEPGVKRGNGIDNPQLHWLYLLGRIKPGVDTRATEAQMQTEQLYQWLTQWTQALGSLEAAEIPRQKLHLQPGGGGMGVMRQRYSAGLALLMAISGFVLMLVCANLANLKLSSTRAARERKFEDKVARSVEREMSMGENYERNITPIRSNISRFREALVVAIFNCDMVIFRPEEKQDRANFRMADHLGLPWTFLSVRHTRIRVARLE